MWKENKVEGESLLLVALETEKKTCDQTRMARYRDIMVLLKHFMGQYRWGKKSTDSV